MANKIKQPRTSTNIRIDNVFYNTHHDGSNDIKKLCKIYDCSLSDLVNKGIRKLKNENNL